MSTRNNTETKNSMYQKEGFLLKRGEKINKAFKVRWFKVDGKNRRLLYFKTKESSKPINWIDLSNSVIRVCRENLGEKFCFEVIIPQRVYYLVAVSIPEMYDWIRILSSNSLVQSQNEKIEQAEEMIQESELQRALYEEQNYIRKRNKYKNRFSKVNNVDNKNQTNQTTLQKIIERNKRLNDGNYDDNEEDNSTSLSNHNNNNNNDNNNKNENNDDKEEIINDKNDKDQILIGGRSKILTKDSDDNQKSIKLNKSSDDLKSLKSVSSFEDLNNRRASIRYKTSSDSQISHTWRNSVSTTRSSRSRFKSSRELQYNKGKI
eukprot:TRINITY_DN11018_c0_g1_i1.p1 TRINITY_DN11018_c0_g1~~TRINITY_DN11018_c0_g1_i1.p1  ORF type:complete len:319 (+),score=55.58 TRINITY_DN11018_c0_g1_i1:33-989(+)